jgi:hypothetical protein
MKAIQELEQLGYTFTLDGVSVHYAHHGERPDPEQVRPFLEYVGRHRDEAVAFLWERATLETDGMPAKEAESCYPVTLVWPTDLEGVGVVEGQWRWLETGEIEATYPDPESLALAMAPVLADYDGSPEGVLKVAEALRRWTDIPPPMKPCRPFGTGEHRRFWRRMDEWDSGWICAICYPPPPGVEVETWKIPA